MATSAFACSGADNREVTRGCPDRDTNEDGLYRRRQQTVRGLPHSGRRRRFYCVQKDLHCHVGTPPLFLNVSCICTDCCVCKWPLASEVNLSLCSLFGGGGGKGGSQLGTSASIWPALPAPEDNDDDECRAVGAMRTGPGNQSTRKKPAVVPIC
jgi:hypothetical protein